ncbi:hypothetical protein B8A39_05085 [Dolosigranulum pigrum]|nr:hypothetical protein FE324_00200 [Dolosigranulum pigrum]RAN52532.1 hypothetical protein B8A39_05085 [Dolosigranulum pigrum]
MIGYIGPNGVRMSTTVKIILGLLSTISKYDSRIYLVSWNNNESSYFSKDGFQSIIGQSYLVYTGYLIAFFLSVHDVIARVYPIQYKPGCCDLAIYASGEFYGFCYFKWKLAYGFTTVYLYVKRSSLVDLQYQVLIFK